MLKILSTVVICRMILLSLSLRDNCICIWIKYIIASFGHRGVEMRFSEFGKLLIFFYTVLSSILAINPEAYLVDC